MLRLKVLQDKRAVLLRSSLLAGASSEAVGGTTLRRRVSATGDASAARAAEKTAALERVHSLMTMELERMAAIGDVMGAHACFALFVPLVVLACS